MKMDFEDGKYVTWFGVSGYFGLQGVLWCWKRWVERGEVFSGRRRRMVKRVSPIPSEAVRLSERAALGIFDVAQLSWFFQY